MRVIGLLISFFIISPFPAAAQSTVHCSTPDVVSVEARTEPTKADSRTFTYKAKFIKQTDDPNATTVIILPGGPGQTSMENAQELQLPKTFNFVLTDPRTLGCNKVEGGVISNDAIRTENLAYDVMAIIKKLGLKNYVLYGISYGTQLATVLQDLLQKNNMGARAVVLEGIVHPTSDDWMRNGYNAALWRLYKRLSPEAREKILSLSEGSPDLLGASVRDWAEFLSGLFLQIGALRDSDEMNLARILEEGLGPKANEQSVFMLKIMMEMSLKESRKEYSKEQENLYKQIACREITFHVPESRTLVNGRIRPAPGSKNLCVDIAQDRPYRTQDYQLKTKIYYVQGVEDPNTPPGQARRHFQFQKQAERLLLLVEKAGHNPSASDPVCMAQIWDMIGKDSFDASGLKEACAFKVHAVHRKAGH